MTEDEAKLKQCCGAGGYFNDNPRPANWCVASECMAWRWAGYRTDSGKWVRKTAGTPWKPEHADGYCGLAGAQP